MREMNIDSSLSPSPVKGLVGASKEEGFRSQNKYITGTTDENIAP